MAVEASPNFPLAMSNEIVIQVESIAKSYALWSSPAARLHGPLFGRVGQLPFLPVVARQLCQRVSHHAFRNFFALTDVSFAVRRGECVGVIGRNGAGKSTLLQLIVGTLQPTSGTISVTGRVAALLELGSGFNPEFSGRENVYLNAAILGMSRAEIDTRFAEIAAFADIGDFLEQPVKTYSSGMLVRLAFAVSVCATPDILIVDEALSVGDMYFQAKCMARIEQMRRAGVTILFVSHNLQAVKAICDRAIFLEKGKLVAEGEIGRVTDAYSAAHLHETGAQRPAAASENAAEFRSACQPLFARRVTERTGRGDARYYECAVFQGGREVDTVLHGADCEVVAWLQHVTELGVNAEVGIVVRNLDGLELFAINSFFLRQPYPPQPPGSRQRIVFQFPVKLAPGVYSVVLGVKVPQQGEYWDKVFNAAVFRVVTKAGEFVPGLFAQPGKVAYFPA